VVVSSALESAVGISQGIRLAAALNEEPAASGLATGVLFTDDVARHEIKDGTIEVKNLSTIDRSALDSLAVESERFSWWQDRLRESYEVLFS
jgi:O-succinylbenzoate synthase